MLRNSRLRVSPKEIVISVLGGFILCYVVLAVNSELHRPWKAVGRAVFISSDEIGDDRTVESIWNENRHLLGGEGVGPYAARFGLAIDSRETVYGERIAITRLKETDWFPQVARHRLGLPCRMAYADAILFGFDRNTFLPIGENRGLAHLPIVSRQLPIALQPYYVGDRGIPSNRGLLAAGIPVFPIWKGLLVNLFAYSSVTWIILYLPWHIVRFRRKRKGRCVHCGYPVPPGQICTECGKRAIPG